MGRRWAWGRLLPLQGRHGPSQHGQGQRPKGHIPASKLPLAEPRAHGLHPGVPGVVLDAGVQVADNSFVAFEHLDEPARTVEQQPGDAVRGIERPGPVQQGLQLGLGVRLGGVAVIKHHMDARLQQGLHMVEGNLAPLETVEQPAFVALGGQAVVGRQGAGQGDGFAALFGGLEGRRHSPGYTAAVAAKYPWVGPENTYFPGKHGVVAWVGRSGGPATAARSACNCQMCARRDTFSARRERG